MGKQKSAIVKSAAFVLQRRHTVLRDWSRASFDAVSIQLAYRFVRDASGVWVDMRWRGASAQETIQEAQNTMRVLFGHNSFDLARSSFGLGNA